MKKYWNREGKFEDEYLEMVGDKDFDFNESERKALRRYYRYYNDGDLPWGNYGYSISQIEVYLEEQVNIAIAKAYKRFKKEVSNIIRFYARNELKNIKRFWGAN